MMTEIETTEEYLTSTFFIDSDSAPVKKFAENACKGLTDGKKKGIALYYAIRDRIPYDAYAVTLKKEELKASYVLQADKGFCIQKSVLLTAACRAAGIPSRLGFADVRNHLATEKLLQSMRTDIFYFHGYNELFINNKWVKCTPAFNKELCYKFSLQPLEFDGEHDSIFHPFDKSGHKFMDYIHHYGTFSDLPYDLMIVSFKKGYPHFFEEGNPGWPKRNYDFS